MTCAPDTNAIVYQYAKIAIVLNLWLYGNVYYKTLHDITF